MVWSGRFDELFIAGSWQKPDSDARLAVRFPGTGEVFAEVPSASRADMDRAVTAAREAFDRGPWPRWSLDQRVTALRVLERRLNDSLDRFAELITEEMGCPSRTSRAVQAVAAHDLLSGYLESALAFPYRGVRRSGSAQALVTREPVGVVAAIVPWNVPLVVTIQKLAPALLAGCTIVLKPAPETPLDAYLLADLLEDIGLPQGVVNVVPGDRDVSEYLVSHPGVDKVSFTGSTAAGRRIASICGRDLRRATLELGGKSAALFLDDADFDTSVESLRLLSFRNSGQVCSLKTRIIVSRRRESELVERLVALVRSMPVGDPHEPETQIGPMASARQRDTVNDYLSVARQEGAVAAIGGQPTRGAGGFYVQPTVFAGVQRDHRIAQEEIFGPVLAVLTYETEDDAVDIANCSHYGLSGAVFCTDLENGLRVAGRLRTGSVELNGCPVGATAPVGGFKASGIGREQGFEGLETYTETRSISLPPSLIGPLQKSL